MVFDLAAVKAGYLAGGAPAQPQTADRHEKWTG